MYFDEVLLIQGNENTREISKEQFIDYYNNYSASITDDQFFESILVNTFKLSQTNALANKYAGK